MHPYLIEFFLVAGAHVLAVASPGPDLAVVVQQSIDRGRRAALWTSLGIGTGIFFHVAYSLLGLGWFFQHYPQVFDVVKYVGAIYLGWLGLKALRGKKVPEPEVDMIGELPVHNDSGVDRGAFVRGFLVNVLNPKAVLFFIALFTVVVAPTTPMGIKVGYGVWMAGATAAWFSAVSFFFAQTRIRQVFLRCGHWFDRVMGVLLLLLALRLAVSSL